MSHLNVFKLGGSLLSATDYLPSMVQYLSEFQEDTNIIICGGGAEVERLRKYQRQFCLTNDECHHNSLTVMDRNTRRLCNQLELPRVNSWPSLSSSLPAPSERPFTTGLLVTDFVLKFDSQLPGTSLPANWETTSDSIAARVASLLDARLFLLKSASAMTDDLAELSRAGYVDSHFPVVAANINSLTFVNLLH